jgi:hypothetical protein
MSWPQRHSMTRFCQWKYQWHHWELNPKPFSLQCSASTNVPVHTDILNMDMTYYKSMFREVFNSILFLTELLMSKKITEQVTTNSSTFVTYLCFKLNICSHTSSFLSTAHSSFYIPTSFSYHCSQHQGAKLTLRHTQCTVHQYGNYTHIRENIPILFCYYEVNSGNFLLTF